MANEPKENQVATKEVPALKISSRPESFCRAGRRWTREPQVIAVSEFTKAQIVMLKAETLLAVEETTLEVPAE